MLAFVVQFGEDEYTVFHLAPKFKELNLFQRCLEKIGMLNSAVSGWNNGKELAADLLRGVKATKKIRRWGKNVTYFAAGPGGAAAAVLVDQFVNEIVDLGIDNLTGVEMVYKTQSGEEVFNGPVYN